MRPFFFFLLALLLTLSTGTIVYFGQQQKLPWQKKASIEESAEKQQEKERPLLAYSIPLLAEKYQTGNYQKTTTKIKVLSCLNCDEKDSEIRQYQILYESQGQQLSATLTIAQELLNDPNKNQNLPLILMVRGYVPAENYFPGNGTAHAAAVFAQAGFVTIAPDFLGYGASDPESTDPWLNRFIKPLNVIDLLLAIRQEKTFLLPSNNSSTSDSASQSSTKITQQQLTAENEYKNYSISINPEKIAFWGHSNGGQITVSVLEILGEKIPTSLWAPVLAPFPYSILYFSDEEADEGKQSRQFIANFEKDYDVFDFSLTQHLDLLQADLQVQHGSNDDSALLSWSQEFASKITAENKRRQAENIEPLQFTLIPYAGADHNLNGAWNSAVQQDLTFYRKELTL
jgi:pimeloyl-ACP methyl ester carboxylesterase